MSIGDSDVGICNTALYALGEQRITSLSDANKRAIICNDEYDKARRFILTIHPWQCAKKQAQIAADAAKPLFTWSSRFALPGDFLRFFAEAEEYDVATWEIMADPSTGALMLYSNDSTPLNLMYIYDLQDCTKMSALLVTSIAYELTSRIGLPITQNPSRVDQALNKLKATLEQTRTVDSQERAPREWDVDVLLRARR